MELIYNFAMSRNESGGEQSGHRRRRGRGAVRGGKAKEARDEGAGAGLYYGAGRVRAEARRAAGRQKENR